MLEALSSFLTLRYTNPRIYHPLPSNITRTFISSPSTPDNKLELLVYNPPSDSNSRSSPPSTSSTATKTTTPRPILFLHGGFGSASVWLPTQSHLSTTQPATPTYALSLRNHGASYSVPYLRMVFGTTITDLANDIVVAVDAIKARTPGGLEPVLVAHSSTGGTVQWLLAEGLAKTSGLVLVDAVPVFGNLGVYANWARRDPWFGVRTMLHGWHPISPLSSVNLVRGVFFGDGRVGKHIGEEVVSDEHVRDFMRWMPKYESLTWPMQMAGSFWGWIVGRPRWLDVKAVLKGVVGGREGGEKVCVLTGSRDVIMDVGMGRRMAEEYRRGIAELHQAKKVDDAYSEKAEKLDGAVIESRGGVRFVVVNGAGHHVQNDVQWKVAAEALRQFVEQL